VLLPVSALLARWRGPQGRRVEVKALRARLARAAREADAGPEADPGPEADTLRALAAEVRDLKPLVLRAFDGAHACGGCGRGRPAPHGRWDGGFCCGGRTEGVFDDDEVAALALAGTRPRDLRPPPDRDDHAGCAFRGATGCSLEPAHRPALCVRFACRELEAELRAAGRWSELRALARRLDEAMRRLADGRRRLALTARGPSCEP
jgi:hypothetical protein